MITSSDLRGIISRRHEIPPRAQLLYLLVIDDLSDGRPFPSVATLAGTLGVTERSVYMLLADLVACGELPETSPLAR
jgi:hypothetical protein